MVRLCLRLLDTAGKASSAATGGKVRCSWEHPEDHGEVLRPVGHGAVVAFISHGPGEVLGGAGRRTVSMVFMEAAGEVAAATARRLAEPPEQSVSAWWRRLTRNQLVSSRTSLESLNEVQEAGGWYIGPLPKSCGHDDHGSLAKTTANEPFRTTGTAAYPPAMDLAIAEAIVGSFLEDCATLELRNRGQQGRGPLVGLLCRFLLLLGRLWGRAATLQSVRLLGLLLQLRGLREQGSLSHTASSSAAKSSTSAQASQAVSAGGSHLAAGSSTGAQASQAVSARC